MREDLGENLCAYSEEELRDAVRKVGPIKYYVSEDDNGEGVEDDKDRKGTAATDRRVKHVGLSSKKSCRLRLEWDREYAGLKGMGRKSCT